MSTSSSTLAVATDGKQFLMHRPSPERLLSCQVFPELQSQTYSEVIDDTAELVKPLQDNQDLQREFSSLLRKPHRDLLKLSNMVGVCSQGIFLAPIKSLYSSMLFRKR
jgi:hypothetical protein